MNKIRSIFPRRRKGSHDSILLMVIAVPVFYIFSSIYLVSTLSKHANNYLYSPLSLREHSSQIAMILPTKKPRVFGFYFVSVESSSLAQRPPSRLPVHWENAIYELYPSKRTIILEERDKKAQHSLQNSEWYNETHHNPLKPYESHKECVPMHDWQTESFPNCNSVHEADLGTFFLKQNGRYRELVSLLAHGYFRDVYKTKDSNNFNNIALKTNRFERAFDSMTLDRHRMDALVMDRMTSSPQIMDIYGFCGVGSLVEYADGGDLMTLLNEESSASKDEDSSSVNFRRLQYALEISSAIADLHTIDSKDGIYSSIVHGKNMSMLWKISILHQI